jgi:O-antigen/teichoic acid export membrane protein
LAQAGGGVASYVWAVLLRGIVGTGLIYLLAPWPAGLGFSKSSFMSLMSFGLPYQLNSLLAVVKDRFVNIILWKIIGVDGVGIIGWAQNWSQLPLRFVMDNVTKVTFPSFSRLQDNNTELKKAIEKTLFFITFLTFPLVAGMAIIAPVFVRNIPGYTKWEIALIPLALYCFNSALAAISTPLTNTLNAIGKVKINTYLMIMWTALTWIFTPYLALRLGFMGVAYATGFIALFSFVPVFIVRHYTGFSLSSSILKPAIATLVMLPLSYFLSLTLSPTLPNLIVNIIASGMVYLLVCLLLVGQELVTDGQKIAHAFRSKH